MTEFKEIRHASPQYREMVELRQAVLRTPLGLEFSPAELEAERDSFHIGGYVGDRLTACLVLKPLSESQVRLRQMLVVEKRRGQGTGRDLVAFAESFARQKEYAEIVLHARVEAVPFYEKLGYVVDGEKFLEVTIPHRSMRKILR